MALPGQPAAADTSAGSDSDAPETAERTEALIGARDLATATGAPDDASHAAADDHGGVFLRSM